MRCAPYIFFLHDTATTEIYTLSLHDALPIYWREQLSPGWERRAADTRSIRQRKSRPRVSIPPRGCRPNRRRTRWAVTTLVMRTDRKSTRLNSSHEWRSYAVFCLKKKRNEKKT